jgi:hypothetical protein
VPELNLGHNRLKFWWVMLRLTGAHSMKKSGSNLISEFLF